MNMPKHVAIILDGNGRWAKERGKPRVFGHQQGAKKAVEILEHAVKIGIPVLTLWGFSTENWHRPGYEVKALMRLFEQFALRQAGKLDQSNIKVQFIGRREALPESLQRLMKQVEEGTCSNTGLLLRPAINYSGTQEFVDAASCLVNRGESVTDESVRQEIWGDVPPYDLIIRSGKERRTSDFPVGHAELVFSDLLWPDFSTEEFDRCLAQFSERQRRFGGVTAVVG